MDPAENAQKFTKNSLGIGAMQHQISAQEYINMMADGEMQMSQGVAASMTNVLNAGGLAQGLFIVGNPSSQPAASFLHEKVRNVAHLSGRTCIHLCGETIDLRTFGKSTSSNTAGKHMSNNCLSGNVPSLGVDNHSSGDESPLFVGIKTSAAPTPKVVLDEALAGKLDRVQKRAGELAFFASSPGTDPKASKVYKCIVAGNYIITSICPDFPDKLLQEVITMSMPMMTPTKKKKR
jgi:hypothetical protein